MTQRTISAPLETEGIGIHFGKRVRVRVLPAPANSGIQFRVQKGMPIPASLTRVKRFQRATCLTNGLTEVYTVEHLLAALYGLGVTNLLVELDQQELPILDGSSAEWTQMLQATGIEGQSGGCKSLIIKNRLMFSSPHGQIIFSPDKGLRFSHTVLFDGSPIQQADVHLDDFTGEIAPARTYCFSSDLLKLKKTGLLGGLDSLAGFVVVDEKNTAYLKDLFSVDIQSCWYDRHPFPLLSVEPPRFENEMARHKILDMIGDFSLSGYRMQGRIEAVGTGHQDNHDALRLLLSRASDFDLVD